MGAPDYYKSILLYGLYNGSPVPLACDEQGRLILVTEPISPFDRSGTIIWQEDFTIGLVHVATGVAGTGAAVELYDTEALSGGFSCSLTGGSDSLRTATILCYASVLIQTKCGVELAVRWGEYVEQLYIYLDIYDGTYRYQANLRFVVADDAWKIYDYATLSWHDILTNQIYHRYTAHFYRFKFVVDPVNMCYHRFKHVGGNVDLAAYSLDKSANTNPPYLHAMIYVKSDAGQNGNVLIDDVIITQDES